MIKHLLFSFVFFTVFLLTTPLVTFAATSEFTIKTEITGAADTIPPTTPTLLTANPVAPTQIDVTWSVSVDDTFLSGYVLLRNGTPIATTTLTSFNDTGLTASTTYSYEVYAFDWVGNISTTSNLLATTTPDYPPVIIPPTATSTPSQGTLLLLLKSLNIRFDKNTATLEWETTMPARYALRWGRTDAYDDGFLVNDTYRDKQKTTITGLEPGTSYRFELIGYHPNGSSVVLKRGSFTTETSVQIQAVPNVERLVASVKGEDVRLNWELPNGVDISEIRVVRSHLGYPLDSYDGAVVYRGKGTSVLDYGALHNYSPQYYTVFVVSTDGSVSSGAVVMVWRERGVGNSDSDPEQGSPTIASSTLPEIPVFGFEVQNIKLVQGSQQESFSSEKIVFSHQESFLISIPYESVPKHLKAIIVTLLDPTDQRKSYSFLLRINKTGDAYEALVAPLNVIGNSRLQVEIYDFERLLVGRYRKQIEFAAQSGGATSVIFPDALVAPLMNGLTLTTGLFVLVILLLLFILWRRRDNKEDEKITGEDKQ